MTAITAPVTDVATGERLTGIPERVLRALILGTPAARSPRLAGPAEPQAAG